MSNKCVNTLIKDSYNDLLIPSEGSLRAICYKIFLVKYYSTILLLLLAALICQSASHFYSFMHVIFFYSGFCHPGCYQPPHDNCTDGLWLNLLTYSFPIVFSSPSSHISEIPLTINVLLLESLMQALLATISSPSTLLLQLLLLWQFLNSRFSQAISSLLSLFPNST